MGGVGSTALKVIVLCVTGVTYPEKLVCPMLKTGTFMAGLRAVGAPMICAASGRITGALWNLVLTSDYKISAANATFIMPLVHPMPVIKNLVNSTTATELCMRHGPIGAISMLEFGLIHMLAKGFADAKLQAMQVSHRLA